VEPRLVETPGAPRPLRLIAGDLALDFANTVDRPQGQPLDHLTRYSHLVGWTSQAGVIGAALARGLLQTAEQNPHRAHNVTAEAHRLRENIGELFDPGTASRDAQEHWLNLRKYVGGAYRAASIEPTASPGDRWKWSDPSDLRTPLYHVAVAAGDLMNSADLHQIKRCANCPWLFVDRSRNHQRRWCDMDDCGRVSKIRLASARRHSQQR
jgi:predicted RNA-binding Zn ribbon-like protein